MKRTSPYFLSLINNLFFFFTFHRLLTVVFLDLPRFDIILFIFLASAGLVDFFTEQELQSFRVQFEHGIRKIILGLIAVVLFCRIVTGGFEFPFYYLLVCCILFLPAFYTDRQPLRKMQWLEETLKPYSGNALKDEIREYSLYAGEIVRGLRVLQALAVVRFLIIFLGVGVREIRGLSLVAGEQINIMLFLCLAVFYLVFIQSLIHKEKLMASGHFPDEQTWQRKRFFALLLIVLIVLGALIFARNWSLFSYTVFERLLELLPDRVIPDDFTPEFSQTDSMSNFAIPQDGPMTRETPPWILNLVKLIIKVFTWMFYLLVTAFIIYLIYPFFTGAFLKYLGKLFRHRSGLHFRFFSFSRIWEAIQDFFYYLFRPPDKVFFGKGLEKEYKTEAPGILKKRQTDRFRGAFLSLVHLASEAGNPYQPGSAPSFFFMCIKEQFPLTAEEVSLCQKLYNQALFSRYLLKRVQSNQFFKSMKSVELVLKRSLAEKNGKES